MTSKFEVRIDIDWSESFPAAGDITEFVHALDWHIGMATPGGVMAPDAYCAILAYDEDKTLGSTGSLLLAWGNLVLHWGDYALGFETGSLFERLRVGMMVRVRRLLSTGWATLYQGWISNVRAEPGVFQHAIQIDAQDLVGELRDVEISPALRENVLVSDEIRETLTLAQVEMFYARSWWVLGVSELGDNTKLWALSHVEIDDSPRKLPWVGDAEGGFAQYALSYIERVMFAEFGGRFFTDRMGRFTFHARERDYEDAVARIEGAEYSDAEVGYSRVLNDVSVDYYPRRPGTPGEPIYTLGEPLEVEGFSSGSARFRFYDPASGFASVGGVDLIEPEAEVDYRVVDDGGQDVTGRARVSVELSGSGGELTVVNPTPQTLTLEFFRVRGTALVSYQRERFERHDLESIGIHGRRRAPASAGRYLSSEAMARSYAGNILSRNAVQTLRADRVEVDLSHAADDDEALAAKILALTVGDVVDLRSEEQGYMADCVIVGEEHQVEGFSHKVNLIVKPAYFGDLWRVGESRLGDDTALGI